MKAGVQSDILKADKIFDLVASPVHVDGTFVMQNSKDHYVTVSEVHEYVDNFFCDKHEESIVWKGGPVSSNLNDQKFFYPKEGQGLDDFYESDSQQEAAILLGNERIDQWAATWPHCTVVNEDCLLDSIDCSTSSFSSVHSDCGVQVEATPMLTPMSRDSPLDWSDTGLHRSIQERIHWQRHGAEADNSSVGSSRSLKLEKEKGSCKGHMSGLKELHGGCKSLMELDLPLSQDRFEVFSSTALDASTSLRERCISGSNNGDLQLAIGHAKEDDNDKLSSSGTVSAKCDSTFMKENFFESPRQIVDTEELDKLFIEAKCRKENLKKDMGDIYLLRQKAEQEELAAQETTVEATRGGLDILSKVKDLQQQTLQERVEYDMRAAEVYGEKCVLAMEARELRSRLLETQAEQTRALSMLDSVRSTLTARLEKAYQEKHSAVVEATLKEECARELLAQEEDFARTLAENFKMLEAEAETCRKLRDFLIDRGNVVDSLQGEMAVLCEDVFNFKRQVDEGLLLTGSRSLSWSQMSQLTEPKSLSIDVKAGQSPRSLTFESCVFLKLPSDTSILSSSSATSGIQTSAGLVDCTLQSQYVLPNVSSVDTLHVLKEEGQDVTAEVVDRVVSPVCVCGDNGQQQEQPKENSSSASTCTPVL